MEIYREIVIGDVYLQFHEPVKIFNIKKNNFSYTSIFSDTRPYLLFHRYSYNNLFAISNFLRNSDI